MNGFGNPDHAESRPTRVAALAGRRPDAPGAKARVFPATSIPHVRSQLRSLFTEQRIGLLVSSAAAGADLLALDVADSLGLRRQLVLPFSIDAFQEKSVADKAGDWMQLFERVISHLGPNDGLRVLDDVFANPEDAYSAASHEILNLSEAYARQMESHPPLAVVVWNGTARRGRDMTAEFRTEAIARSFAVMDVLTTGGHELT